MDKTQKRERVILSVTEDLGSKLDVLGEFLDNINKRRPMGKMLERMVEMMVLTCLCYCGSAINYHMYEITRA